MRLTWRSTKSVQFQNVPVPENLAGLAKAAEDDVNITLTS